jgi:hypothetical protein
MSSDIKNVTQQTEKEEVVETATLEQLDAEREIVQCEQNAIWAVLQKRFTKIPANIEDFIRFGNKTIRMF